MRPPYLVCCTALTSLLVFAVPANSIAAPSPASSAPVPAPSPDQGFEFKYTTAKPGTRTGLRFTLAERLPAGVNPPKLRSATVTIPAGMRLDRSVARRCRESDSEPAFPTFGARCLPAAIGAGTRYTIARPNPGELRQEEGSVLVYNTRRGMLINGVKEAGGIRVTFRGRQMTLTFPDTRGGLSNSTINLLRFYLNPLSQRRRVRRHHRSVVVRRNLFTTPARCPSSGVWSSSVTAMFYDDPTPRRSVSTSRCRR